MGAAGEEIKEEVKEEIMEEAKEERKVVDSDPSESDEQIPHNAVPPELPAAPASVEQPVSSNSGGRMMDRVSEMQVEDNVCDCVPRILVVDDTAFNLMAVVTMVKELYDIDVTEAANGKIALDLYKDSLKKDLGIDI